jgi:predicted HAD superfamily phosphohydrolase
MAILVDTPIWPFRGRLWCHLVSDTSYDELHALAETLGIPRGGFQGDHYDLPEELRDAAIALGAQAVSGRELITRLRASGLRRPHRH